MDRGHLFAGQQSADPCLGDHRVRAKPGPARDTQLYEVRGHVFLPESLDSCPGARADAAPDDSDGQLLAVADPGECLKRWPPRGCCARQRAGMPDDAAQRRDGGGVTGGDVLGEIGGRGRDEGGAVCSHAVNLRT